MAVYLLSFVCLVSSSLGTPFQRKCIGICACACVCVCVFVYVSVNVCLCLRACLCLSLSDSIRANTHDLSVRSLLLDVVGSFINLLWFAHLRTGIH